MVQIWDFKFIRMTSATSSLFISEGWLRPSWEAHRHSVLQARHRSVGTEAGLPRPRSICRGHRASQLSGRQLFSLKINIYFYDLS